MKTIALVGLVTASLLVTSVSATAADFRDFHSPQTNAAGDTVFFAGYAPGKGTELWKSDGTAAGTTLVKDLYQGPNGSLYRGYAGDNQTENGPQFTSIGDKTFFLATTDKTGPQLWVTDGSSAGTIRLTTNGAGVPGRIATNDMIAYKGELYFTAKDSTHGVELWKSDGTVAGTQFAVDAAQGVNAKGQPYNGSPRNYAILGDTLVFQGQDIARKPALYSTDGTSSSLLMPLSQFSTSVDVAVTSDSVVVRTKTSLYETDGTVAGTTLTTLPINGSNEESTVAFDGSLFYESSVGRRLVRLTGDTATLLTAVTANNFIVAGGTLWFTTYTSPTKAVALWKLSSATVEPEFVADLGLAASPYVQAPSVYRDGLLYIWSYKSLYVTDGTTGGTSVIKNFGYPRGLESGMYPAFAGDSLVLTGVDVEGNGSAWVSDLTPGGTELVIGGGSFVATVPSIQGTPSVGSRLNALVPAWTPSMASFTYQWKLDGVPIEGATAKSFVIPAAMTGSITFAVTGRLPGYQTVTKTSVAKLIAKNFEVAPIPTVTGSKTVGSYLRAVPGTWSPSATFTYQWYSAGVKIATNGNRSTFKVTTATVGKPITVKVGGSAPGYVNTNRSSAPR